MSCSHRSPQLCIHSRYLHSVLLFNSYLQLHHLLFWECLPCHTSSRFSLSFQQNERVVLPPGSICLERLFVSSNQQSFRLFWKFLNFWLYWTYCGGMVNITVHVTSVQFNKTPSAHCILHSWAKAKSLSVPIYLPFVHSPHLPSGYHYTIIHIHVSNIYTHIYISQ